MSADERVHAPGLERAFDLGNVEGAGPAVLVDGAVPAGLTGTAYWNGPGGRGHGAVRYRHWLDGDGLVAALRFGDGGVTFSSRFVLSTKRRDELAAGAALYRAFGTRFPGDRLQMGLGLASPVNVSVHPFAGRLLAFGEQGLPWELDADTLATVGEHSFGGALNGVSPFSAHPCIDRASGEMFAFGVSFAAQAPLLHVYHFGAGGGLRRRVRVPLPYPCSLHDFALAGDHLVFYVNPYLLDARQLLAEGRTVQEALSWHPELGSRLLVLRRSDLALAAEIPIGGRYCLHWINAFEDGAELVADFVELDRPVYDQYEVLPDLFREVAPGRPVRLRLDLARGAVRERRELSYDRAPDFPVVGLAAAAHAYERFWMLGVGATGAPGRKFFDELVALDWRADGAEVFRAPRGTYFASEPVPVLRDGGGTLVCLVFESATSQSAAWLFDAGAIARGPVARLRLPHAVPPLFHGAWHPAA